jgi:basic amino acid/polyamine antiporter, APA family
MCILVMLSSLGAINGMLCTNSRIFAEFGADHSLFAPLARWSKRWGTPVIALVVQLVVCAGTIAVMAGWVREAETFNRLITGTAPCFWLFFLATGVAFFVLRAKDPGIERPFSAPAYPLTPLIYCGFCGLMVVGSVLGSPIDAGAWLGVLLLGVPLYWLSRYTPRALAAIGRDEDHKIPTTVGE